MKKLEIGTPVHYDSDNKEWGERLVGDGTIIGWSPRGYLVLSDTHRADILFKRHELSVIPTK